MSITARASKKKAIQALRIICVTETQQAQTTQPCPALNSAAIKGEVSLTFSDSYSCNETLFGTHFDGLILQKNQTNTTFVRQLRHGHPKLPILVIIDNALPAGIADLLDAGADDCQNSHIKSVELMARLRSIIRRIQGYNLHNITLGRLCLEEDKGYITIDERPIRFTPKEYNAVSYLMKRPQQPCSKDDLLYHLYPGGDFPDNKAIDVLLHRIRRKFNHYKIKKPFIAHWGAGWQFNADAFKKNEQWEKSSTTPSPTKETSIAITGNINMIKNNDQS